MYPIKFKQAYEVPLGAGDNPNTGDLPFVVARDPRTPGPVMLVSCWKLTEAELAEVFTTGCVYAAVMANPEYRTQPPIAIHGKSLFDYPDGAAYKVAPRTFAEEQVDNIIEGANGQIKAQQGERPEDPAPGSQIFPESNGLGRAREVRLDPRGVEAKVREIVAAGLDPFTSQELIELGATGAEVRAIVKRIAEEGGKK